jgi:hypothetical protein
MNDLTTVDCNELWAARGKRLDGGRREKIFVVVAVVERVESTLLLARSLAVCAMCVGWRRAEMAGAFAPKRRWE